MIVKVMATMMVIVKVMVTMMVIVKVMVMDYDTLDNAWPMHVYHPGAERTEIMVTGTRACVLAAAFVAGSDVSTQGVDTLVGEVTVLGAAVTVLAAEVTVLAAEVTVLAAAVTVLTAGITRDTCVSDLCAEDSCFEQWLAQVPTPWVWVGCWC